MGSISGLGRSTGGCNGNPLQYSWWENSMDRGAWWAVVHRVTKELDITHQLNNNDSILFVGAFPSHFLTAVVTEDPRPVCSPVLQISLLSPSPSLCVHAKLLQSCRTVCSPMNCSPVARLLCPWGVSRRECWSGLPCSPPGHLPDPGIEVTSLTSPALAGRFFTTSTTWETPLLH